VVRSACAEATIRAVASGGVPVGVVGDAVPRRPIPVAATVMNKPSEMAEAT
jgi:hypothetical protein